MNEAELDVTDDTVGGTYMGHPVWVVHLKDGEMCAVGKPQGIKNAAWVELIEDYKGKLTLYEWNTMIRQISIL